MITIKNVTLRRSAKVLLEGATVTLNPGEKVGLVGRNGAGKSSLFALLNGNLQEDSGEFYIPTQWRMGQVAQDMPETEQSATEFVIEGDTVLNDARAEVAAAEATEDGRPRRHEDPALLGGRRNVTPQLSGSANATIIFREEFRTELLHLSFT